MGLNAEAICTTLALRGHVAHCFSKVLALPVPKFREPTLQGWKRLKDIRWWF